jgi:hypothetical protein
MACSPRAVPPCLGDKTLGPCGADLTEEEPWGSPSNAELGPGEGEDVA